MGLFHRAVVATLPLVPRALVWRFARRYIAGWTLDEAVDEVERLQTIGACSTFDVLGENLEKLEDTAPFLKDALDALDAIASRKLDASLSVKLTQFGLHLDAGHCLKLMRQILEHAGETFVQIDMEDSSVTEATLQAYRSLAADFDNVGIVLQAYLRRTPDDIDAYADLKPVTRLCKGIYLEPPEVAFQDYEKVRAQFLLCLQKLLDNGQYVGIATHDPYLVEQAEAEITRRGLAPDAYEFQMLLGVAEPLRAALIERGHRLRVYIPYGPDWYAYATRRLQENPSIAGHIVSNLFKRRRR